MQMQSSVVSVQMTPQQQQQPRFYSSPKFQGSYQKTNNLYNSGSQFRPSGSQGQQNAGGGVGGGNSNNNSGVEFDGKRLRKAVIRKTIDYNSAIVKQLELRVWQRDHRDYRAIQPDTAYAPEMPPPPYLVYNPINSVTTKFVRTSTNKMRCPIFCVAWTPEGRRLVTGASSGEFTLWNGLTFNFETILQAHDSPVRCMVWSHNDQWMVTGDHAGFVKYWQSNMNNVKMFQAHKEPLRGISFCPTDHKFATCSDDGTVRIWDFARCHEERILRGHGADVKCLAWHPHKGLLVSGSKDSQQPIKLWDPKSGQSLATLHAHKSTVMEAKWNENGNWLITGSRDHLIKLFDIRKLSQEVQTFRGHKKEVTSLAWHPVHESLFASGGSDGAVMFWLSGVDKEVGSMEQAHDSIVWALAWHPLGHILCSGSNDHTCKFWTRNRPGDKMRDKYNLNIISSGNAEDAAEYDEVTIAAVIPGMGMENTAVKAEPVEQEADASIPGLDFGSEEPSLSGDSKLFSMKKVPYAKPIPRQFQQQWMDNKRPLLVPPPGAPPTGTNMLIPPPAGAPPPGMPPPPQGPPPGMMPPPNFPPPTHMMPPPNSDQSGAPRMPPPLNSMPPMPNSMPPMPPPLNSMPPMPNSMPPMPNSMPPMPNSMPPMPNSMPPSMWPPGSVGNGNQFMPPPMNHPNTNNAGPSQFPSGANTNNNSNNANTMNVGSNNPNSGSMSVPPRMGPSDSPSNDNSELAKGSGGNWKKDYGDNDNWKKDYGDNDFRLQLDSDMRMLSGGGSALQESRGGDSYSSDQDMRARMLDTDARVPQFNNNFPPPGAPPGVDRGGRPNGASRWGPSGGGNDRGQFHPVGGGMKNSAMSGPQEGDWDERMGPPMMDGGHGGGGGGGQNPIKRAWDEGPGGYGDSAGDDQHFGHGPGMMGGPPPRHFNPQGNRGGPPHWQRGNGPRPRFRGGPFRGGPRGGRGGSWEH